MTHPYEPSIYYGPEKEPVYESDNYNDLLFNADGKGFMSHITLESYEYDGAIRLVKLVVETPLRVHEYLEDDVIENISFRNNGKKIVLECKMEIT